MILTVPRRASWLTLCVGLLAVLPPMGSSARAQQVDTTHYPKVLRYTEDYSYLADPAQRSDVWDHLKYIPLGNGGRTYLSFGGEWRERYEYLDGYSFNPGPDNIVLHRLMLSADLHIGDAFRSFVQLSHLSQSGRDGGSFATDENKLDFQQAFFDVSASLSADERATLRVGRHEMMYGSGRFVAIREGPNARRSFDGVRLNYTSSNFQLDGFVTRPVTIVPGGFDDETNYDEAFWGAYSVIRYTPGHALDLYYLGNDYERSNYVEGTASERRHTIGLRLWGRQGAFDYNFEPVYQFGDFGDLTISAFGVALDVGWTLSALPFKPRLGMKANVESGDTDRNDGKLGTLNPLYPNHAYFSEAAVGAPMNDMDLQPNITLTLAQGMTLVVGYDFFWRYTEEDTVYTAGLQPIPGIAGVDGRYVGSLITTHLKWQVDRHIELNFDFTHFNASDVLEAANINDINFGMVSAAYKF